MELNLFVCFGLFWDIFSQWGYKIRWMFWPSLNKSKCRSSWLYWPPSLRLMCSFISAGFWLLTRFWGIKWNRWLSILWLFCTGCWGSGLLILWWWLPITHLCCMWDKGLYGSKWLQLVKLTIAIQCGRLLFLLTILSTERKCVWLGDGICRMICKYSFFLFLFCSFTTKREKLPLASSGL